MYNKFKKQQQQKRKQTKCPSIKITTMVYSRCVLIFMLPHIMLRKRLQQHGVGSTM